MPIHYVNTNYLGSLRGVAFDELQRRARAFAGAFGEVSTVKTSRFGSRPAILSAAGAVIAGVAFLLQFYVLAEILDGLHGGGSIAFAALSEFMTEGLNVAMVVGGLMFVYGGVLSRRPLEAELRSVDTRPPVVYFRSFADDEAELRRWRWRWSIVMFPLPPVPMRVSERFEERIVHVCARYGPFIAIGKPGDGDGVSGAARAYLPDHAWQAKAQSLMDEARAIILVPGPTSGLRWEVAEIVARARTPKLVLLIPPLAKGVPADDSSRRIATISPAFAATPWSAAISAIDASGALAVMFDAEGDVVVLRSADTSERAYRDALEVALYRIAAGQTSFAA